MAKLYTVESYSTFNCVPVKWNKDEEFYYVSLINHKVNEKDTKNNIVIIEEKNIPKISKRKWGLWHFIAISEAIFNKDLKGLPILENSRRNRKHKILLTSLKYFNVIQGEAHHLVFPKSEHNYALIIFSRGSIIELTDRISKKKIIRFKDLR